MEVVDKAVAAINDQIALAKGVAGVETALQELKDTLPTDYERFVALLKTFGVETPSGNIVTGTWIFDEHGKYIAKA